jgi:hypothetical protein
LNTVYKIEKSLSYSAPAAEGYFSIDIQPKFQSLHRDMYASDIRATTDQLAPKLPFLSDFEQMEKKNVLKVRLDFKDAKGNFAIELATNMEVLIDE